MRYAATLTRDDNGTLLVSFPDVPGAHSYGGTVAAALARGQDALLTILDSLMADGMDLPLPRPHLRVNRSSYYVPVPPRDARKIKQYCAARGLA